MKKITVLLLALSLTLTLCACSSSDKIPSLEEIVENGAEWSNEQLQQAQGRTLADLEKAWGEADGELPGEYAYFWKVDDTTSVNVFYHSIIGGARVQKFKKILMCAKRFFNPAVLR